MDRRTFLRIGLLTSLGYVLACCDSQVETPTNKPTQPVAPPTLDGLLAFHKGDTRYPEMRRGFNLRVEKYPAVIVLCRSTDDVASAVRYAGYNNLSVSVKSGGHSFEGFSSNDGGLVVDLSLMNTIEWLPGAGISSGPGVRLSELYDELLPKGRILPAGSCGSVGLSGLTLGGGYGLFSRQLGLTCDSLTGLTLVDGAGAVHDTDDDPELLWACRGGGNGNFGVVTSLRFDTHAAPAGLFSHRFKAYKLTPPRAASLLQTWCDLTLTLPQTSFSAFVLNGQTLTVLVTDTENDDADLHRVLNRLEELTDKTTLGSRQELPSALRRYYGIDHPIYFKNASAGFYSGYSDISATFPTIAETIASHRGMIFQVNTLGGAIANPQREKHSAFAHRSLPFLAELQAYYDKPEQETERLKGFRTVQALLREAGVKRHYRNYPDLDFDDWEEAYYGASYKRLQQVKRRLDPNGVFHHPQCVKP